MAEAPRGRAELPRCMAELPRRTAEVSRRRAEMPRCRAEVLRRRAETPQRRAEATPGATSMGAGRAPRPGSAPRFRPQPGPRQARRLGHSIEPQSRVLIVVRDWPPWSPPESYHCRKATAEARRHGINIGTIRISGQGGARDPSDTDYPIYRVSRALRQSPGWKSCSSLMRYLATTASSVQGTAAPLEKARKASRSDFHAVLPGASRHLLPAS